MAAADHIFVRRSGYTHHGIDMGDGTVIHYTGEVCQKAGAAVRQTVRADFACGGDIWLRQYEVCDEIRVTLDRARSRLGENTYNLMFNNCEHFACWGKTGRHHSDQVKDVLASGAGTVAGGAAIAGGIGVVSAVGAAAGLSGPGIMAGLASIGGVVGGGAVAGIAMVGLAPATIATGAMCYVMRDDNTRNRKERQARKVGRYSSFVGAAAGTVASVGAVSTFGAAAGLSAAGITSGLAAVGGVVGGGMAAGVAVTAAAPAVAGAAVGYGSYRLFKHFLGGCAAQLQRDRPGLPPPGVSMQDLEAGSKKCEMLPAEYHEALGSKKENTTQQMVVRCSDCKIEFEDQQPPQPCPKCGSQKRSVILEVKPGVVTVSLGMAAMRVVRHWERLLETADDLYGAGCNIEELYKPGYFGAALMVAQTACEVVIELAVTIALRDRKVPDLLPWIDGTVQSYSPRNDKVRGLYELLTNDANLNKQPFWSAYCDMVKRRNMAGHDGQPVSQADARTGINAAKQLVEHVVHHNGLV